MRKLFLALLLCVLPFVMGPTPRAGYRGPAMTFLGDATFTNVLGVGAGSVGYSAASIYSANGGAYKELILDITYLYPVGPHGTTAGLYARVISTAGAVQTSGYKNAIRGYCDGGISTQYAEPNGWNLTYESKTIAEGADTDGAYGEITIENATLKPHFYSNLSWISDTSGQACLQIGGGGFSGTDVTAGGFHLYFSDSGDNYPITGATLTASSDPVQVNAANGLANGDVVVIENCTGETDLNDKAFTVSNRTPTDFTLAEATGGGYGGGANCVVSFAVDAELRLYGVPN